MPDIFDNDAHWSASTFDCHAVCRGDSLGKLGAPLLGNLDDTLPEREWIQTFTGRRFWPLDPRAEDIRIEDIAHALSNICRFTGHTLKFYSVAQHSVLVSRIVPPADALWGLLHDASEAYLTDIAKPVKESPAFAEYKLAEDKLARVVAEAFSLPWPMPASVKKADCVLLATERRDVMRSTDLAWNVPAEPMLRRITPWTPEAAEQAFLDRYQYLIGERFATLKSCGLIPRVDPVYMTAV